MTNDHNTAAIAPCGIIPAVRQIGAQACWRAEPKARPAKAERPEGSEVLPL